MIYLIYTTLLVAALALVMIFKIVAYMSEKYEARFIQLLARCATRGDQIDHLRYWEEIYQGAEEVKSVIAYTDDAIKFGQCYGIGQVDFIADEDRKQSIIKRRVVMMGSYMLEKGYIKIQELDSFRDNHHPDIKYIELTAKVLKPKD